MPLLPFLKSKSTALVAIAGLIVLGQCFVANVPDQYIFVAAAAAAAVLPIAFAAFKDVSIDRIAGDLSYPVYLVHYPVIQFLSDRYTVVVAVSLLVSCLIVVGLERPLDQLRHRIASMKWTKDRVPRQIATNTAFEMADTADEHA